MNLWVKLKEQTHQITSYNVHEEAGKYQLWVTKANGRTLKVKESASKQEIVEYKEMIDFAVANSEPLVELM